MMKTITQLLHITFVLFLSSLADSFSSNLFKIQRHRLPQRKICLNLTKNKNNEHDSCKNIWLHKNNVETLCKEISSTPALVCDVTYYENSVNDDHETVLRESFYRINPHIIATSAKETKQFVDTLYQENPIPQETIKPIEVCTTQTLRWCDAFVQELNLCPWAKLSLQSNNAIRIKILKESMGIDAMEEIIRLSADELIELTDNSHVDMLVAITFVVAIPDTEKYQSSVEEMENQEHEYGFDFQEFYAFATDLEDRLFDEADEAYEEAEETGEDLDVKPVGDEITIAPFHPKWKFGDSEMEGKNPLNYEKMSPYPTISLVRTQVITQAGEEATERIGDLNKETLLKTGAENLSTIYNRDVL